MSLAELQKFTFVSKYAQYNSEMQRRETWDEAVNRVRDMMLRRFVDKGIDEDINWAYEMMRQKRVLGSQRALQFGGKAIENKEVRIYNCCFSYCDRPRFFQEAMFLLLCGCGVGFSVEEQHIKKLPKFTVDRQIHKQNFHKTHIVQDSIEGWSDALGVLFSSYFDDPVFPEYTGCDVEFDFSEVRPLGSPLSSSSGKAPGPEPLKLALGRIKSLLDICLKNGQKSLSSINAYDCIMYASDCVLSGGVRRSATICFFSPTDDDMLNAKTGNWLYENPQRARSNNSVILVRSKTSFNEFKKYIEKIREYGEPGFYWVEQDNYGGNPCLEIGLYGYDGQGRSGWQMCNLSTINSSKIKSDEDFYKACRAAAIIGSLQASFTKFDYLGEISENICKREALLGVSMTGMMECFTVVLEPNIQKRGAKIVLDTNKEISEKIGTNLSSRSTCCKPEGTTSCLLGTSSGVHPQHAKRYFRTVQVNKTEKPYQLFKQINPAACEQSVWSANDTDDIISFCVEIPDGAKLKNQFSAIEFLEIVKSTYVNWVKPGTRPELCVAKGMTHSVSNTVIVKEDEWEDVTKFIYKNRDSFSGVSLLPFSGDKDYQQAPFTTVYLPHEIVSMYGDASLFASGIIESALQCFDNLWMACDVFLGLNDKLETSIEQETWLIKANRFTVRYFNGNKKQMCYALKDIFLWKKWCDLTREYKPVDYTKCIEYEDNTKLEETVACAGGKCDL